MFLVLKAALLKGHSSPLPTPAQFGAYPANFSGVALIKRGVGSAMYIIDQRPVSGFTEAEPPQARNYARISLLSSKLHGYARDIYVVFLTFSFSQENLPLHKHRPTFFEAEPYDIKVRLAWIIRLENIPYRCDANPFLGVA